MAASGRIEREIELARERLSTLTAEVVTGQVDVSGWSGEEKPAYFGEGIGGTRRKPPILRRKLPNSRRKLVDSSRELTNFPRGCSIRGKN